LAKAAIALKTPSQVIECNRDTGNELTFHSRYRPDLVVPPLGTFGVHDQDKDDDPCADKGEGAVPPPVSVSTIPHCEKGTLVTVFLKLP
jgi:hypothetical protein